jgi:hypothetical protein
MKTNENRLSIREGLNPRKCFEGYDFTNTFSFFGVSVGGVAVAIPGFSGPTTGVDTFGFLGSFVEGISGAVGTLGALGARGKPGVGIIVALGISSITLGSTDGSDAIT